METIFSDISLKNQACKILGIFLFLLVDFQKFSKLVLDVYWIQTDKQPKQKEMMDKNSKFGHRCINTVRSSADEIGLEKRFIIIKHVPTHCVRFLK